MKVLVISTSEQASQPLPDDLDALFWLVKNDLPKILPRSLNKLVCDLLENIDTSLPETLEHLSCKDAKSIPKLPEKLKTLYCNKLVKLPMLPDTLERLACNDVEIMPLYLPDSLLTLFCKNARVLPVVLPVKLRTLVCLDPICFPSIPKNCKVITL